MENKRNLNKKYNILFVSTNFNYFINDNASFKRMYNNLIFFHKHPNFNVFVIQPTKNKENEDLKLKRNIKTYYFKELRILGENIVPLVDFNLFFIFRIKKIIKKHRIDLIHIDFVFGINCLRLLNKIKISYNSHNVEFDYAYHIGKYYHKVPKWFRFFYPFFLYILEKNALKLVDNVNVISYKDKDRIMEIYNISKEKVNVSTLGLTSEIYYNSISKIKARKSIGISEDKFVIIFHGSFFGNFANQEAIKVIKDIIAPNIKDENILILIAGKMPNFRNQRNLRFLGYVKDLKSFIYSADIAIAPIFRGSGINTKIIDYLSGKIPIVTTQKGAEGLKIENGKHGFIVKNSIEEFIKKVKILYNNEGLIKNYKLNIEKLLKETYQWKDILEKLADKYIEIIEK